MTSYLGIRAVPPAGYSDATRHDAIFLMTRRCGPLLSTHPALQTTEKHSRFLT